MSSASEDSAFVPSCKYDVFVSYAHVSNEPALEDTPGWVTKLVGLLKQNLAESLGRKDAFKLWMDEGGLAGNKPLTPEILSILRETATLLIVMSPGYLASDWCQNELAEFLEAVHDLPRNDTRIFVVVREPVNRDDLHPQLRDLRRYEFWVEGEHGDTLPLGFPVPRAEDRQYWRQHSWLSHELSGELKEIKKATEQPPERDTTPPDRPVVFLAKETDEDLRREVADYLEQFELRVEPPMNQAYSYEAEEFRQVVNRDLDNSTIFVQLLTDCEGRTPPGASRRYIEIQHELAVAADKPILLWRSPKLDLARFSDAEYRDLLQGETVLAVGIEEFKRTVVERAQEEFDRTHARQTPDSSSAFVRISAETDDESLKTKIVDTLKKHRVAYDADEFASMQKELEYVFKNCDGLIIAYDESSKATAVDRLRACKTLMFRSNRNPVLLALYQGPPPETPDIGILLPRMRTIDGREDVNETELLNFIGDIEKETAVKPDNSS